MISQLTIFGEELELTDQPLFQGGSLASRTALQESVKRLLTSVISGQNTGDLLAILSQDGLWPKMYQGCLQAKMDGSFEEYSEILPRRGMMRRGQFFQPRGLEPSIDESEWRLLPTPRVFMENGAGKNRFPGSESYRGNLEEALRTGPESPTLLNPNFVEIMAGYPTRWTDLDASEIP